MQAHRFVRETVENNEVSEFETYQMISCFEFELELGPAEIDVGILAAAYLFDEQRYGP